MTTTNIIIISQNNSFKKIFKRETATKLQTTDANSLQIPNRIQHNGRISRVSEIIVNLLKNKT